MRVLSLLAVTAVLLGFASADRENASGPASVQPVADTPTACAPETQPAEPKKKKEKSVDDEIKALGLKPCSVSAIMGRWKSGKVEKKLKTWAEGGTPDFDDAKKTALNLAGMAKLVEWSKNKHRSTDPKAHDQLIAEFETSSKKLAESAIAKDAEGVKTASAEINNKCSDCHSRFK